MKEYTYTNKAYLGINEGVVPPAPQYLWLNSEDNKLYKFGDGGWEVIDNAPYVVEEFTVIDIAALANESNPELTISRDFLDAMYKGLPIMVKVDRSYNMTVPISVKTIADPSTITRISFCVKHYNIEYQVTVDGEIITDNKTLSVHIITHNSVDWNENDSSVTGYIANRSHYLGMKASAEIGNRVSLAADKGTHYFDNYKVFYDGKLYNIPPMRAGEAVDIAGYFKLQFTGYSVSGNSSTYAFMSIQMSSGLPSPTFQIYGDHEYSRHKALDEFFLPDGAKPWKRVIATTTESGDFIFDEIKKADIAGGVNVVRNKAIYYANGKGSIIINVLNNTSMLEFKILAGGDKNISISGKYVWENGRKPDTTAANDVIYSFLVLEGKVYASAKVF